MGGGRRWGKRVEENLEKGKREEEGWKEKGEDEQDEDNVQGETEMWV